EGGDSRENALAERVNGILKKEFKIDRGFAHHQQAVKAVDRAVYVYNEIRPHASCDFLTPSQAHKMTGILKKRWKTKNTEWINFSQKREENFVRNKSV
ncbi:MAG: transposase, partial [Bacteroidetes bacterium]|nr:transposase [Bacteroidota bacterium]